MDDTKLTTLVARLMELDPRYVDVIVRRWEDWTGMAATRETDGVAFDVLAATLGEGAKQEWR